MSTRHLAGLCAGFALLAATAATAFAADPQKTPQDFRDVKWGAPPSSVPGLTQVERDGDIVHYEKPDEKKALGGMTVRRVTYSFYKNQFYHAEIDYEGADSAQAMQKSLEAKYGPPDAVRDKTEPSGRPSAVAAWSWPGHAFIGNRYEKDGARGRVFYFYAPLTEASAKAQGIAPAPAQPKAQAADAGGATYKVKKGDSLARIAKAFGATEAALAAANPGLTDKNLKAGATINLPEGAGKSPDAAWGKPAAAPSGPVVEYTVKEGDVLSKVANSHGARTRDVIAANPGVDPDNLKPGTVLRIPAKAQPSRDAPDAGTGGPASGQ
ncbi:LysM peptidoglycan-binding domain-containing protein [Solidesulfovibrio sp.]|uniref:lytic transglycosylase n=1 Tax=Solidesulfovibrio sp. TaxID=2910990 RepID=UPI00260F340F|nr:LysM peptidoglycan-binding domain-containing protein [Solidesulfovibrio sp.]